MTVAVLVNGTTNIAADGTEQFQPRSEEELTALRELVASAVGFNENRGDVITLKTMQFEPLEPAGTLAQASFFESLAIDVMSMIQLAVLAIVALILGLFVVRPLLSKPSTAPAPQLAAPTPENEMLTPITGEIAGSPQDAQTIAAIPDQVSTEPTGLPDLRETGDDPVDRLRTLIGERQEETVEILRNWLEGEEENA